MISKYGLVTGHDNFEFEVENKDQNQNIKNNSKPLGRISPKGKIQTKKIKKKPLFTEQEVEDFLLESIFGIT